MNYPLAGDGIFDTIQGEGVLSGLPMTFIRLAGCSVGCPQCDTDYRVRDRLNIEQIVERVLALPARKWVWITGGEPTDHDIRPLVAVLREHKRLIAMPTSGRKKIGWGGWNGWHEWADHLYVSSHDPEGPSQDFGQELNVVPGLNGLTLASVQNWNVGGFPTKWVTPCDGKPETLAECIAFVKDNDGWRLGNQSHKSWGVD